MIDIGCACGQRESLSESSVGTSWTCPTCSAVTHLACGESLPEGAGAGDFDACLTIVAGPSGVGERYQLGGVAEIEIGKQPGKHIQLVGIQVSRNHCRLRRLDFGPSRWQLVDENSTNGLFVNRKRITEQELSPGDVVQIGEFGLKFGLVEAALPEPVAAVAAPLPPAPAARVAAKSGPKVTRYTGPAPEPPKASAKAGRLNYATAEVDGPRLLGDCDINWVMKLRNASTLMCWTVIIKYVLWKLGVNFVLAFVPHAHDVIDIIVAAMMVGAVWLLTAAEPEVKGDIFGVRMLLRILGTIGYLGSIVLSVATIMASSEPEADSVVPATAQVPAFALLLSAAQVPAIALLLFYMRRLSKRIPNEALAWSLTLLMIAMPVFVGMGVYAMYQVAQGATDQAVGFGLLAIIGIFVCEICRLGCLVWFNKSFS